MIQIVYCCNSETSWSKGTMFNPGFQPVSILTKKNDNLANQNIENNESKIVSFDTDQNVENSASLFKKLDQQLQENSQASWSKGTMFGTSFQPVSILAKKRNSDIVENPQINMNKMNILEKSSTCHPNVSPVNDEFFQNKKRQSLITSFSDDLDESDIIQSKKRKIEYIEEKEKKNPNKSKKLYKESKSNDQDWWTDTSNDQIGVKELFEKVNETVEEQRKVKNQEMIKRNFKSFRKVVQTKFNVEKVEKFHTAQMAQKIQSDPIVGQLSKSGDFLKVPFVSKHGLFIF